MEQKITQAQASTLWSQPEAINLCCLIERFCPAFGFHVALTGGVLYKEGHRPDLDLVFYRIREVNQPNVEGLLDKLCDLGLDVFKGGIEDFVIKCRQGDKSIDLLFPENYGEYP